MFGPQRSRTSLPGLVLIVALLLHLGAAQVSSTTSTPAVTTSTTSPSSTTTSPAPTRAAGTVPAQPNRNSFTTPYLILTIVGATLLAVVVAAAAYVCSRKSDIDSSDLAVAVEMAEDDDSSQTVPKRMVMNTSYKSTPREAWSPLHRKGSASSASAFVATQDDDSPEGSGDSAGHDGGDNVTPVETMTSADTAKILSQDALRRSDNAKHSNGTGDEDSSDELS